MPLALAVLLRLDLELAQSKRRALVFSVWLERHFGGKPPPASFSDVWRQDFAPDGAKRVGGGGRPDARTHACKDDQRFGACAPRASFISLLHLSSQSQMVRDFGLLLGEQVIILTVLVIPSQFASGW